MTEYNYPKPFISGDLWWFTHSIYNDDDTPYTGYSGYTSVMKVKTYPDDNPNNLVLTFSGNSATIEDNVFTYKMLPTETKLDGKEYYYERYVYKVSEDEDKITIKFGKFPVINR